MRPTRRCAHYVKASRRRHYANARDASLDDGADFVIAASLNIILCDICFLITHAPSTPNIKRREARSADGTFRRAQP